LKVGRVEGWKVGRLKGWKAVPFGRAMQIALSLKTKG